MNTAHFLEGCLTEAALNCSTVQSLAAPRDLGQEDGAMAAEAPAAYVLPEKWSEDLKDENGQPMSKRWVPPPFLQLYLHAWGTCIASNLREHLLLIGTGAGLRWRLRPCLQHRLLRSAACKSPPAQVAARGSLAG